MRMAALVATTLVLAGGAAALGPQRQAVAADDIVTLPTTQLGCRTYFDVDGPGTNAAAYEDRFTLTQSPTNPDAGDKVTVTLTSESGPIDQRDGAKAGTVRVGGDLTLDGTAQGSVSLSTQATYPSVNVERGQALGAYTLTGSYVASGNGPQELTLRRLAFNDVGRSDADVYCSEEGDRDHRRMPERTDLSLPFTVTGPSVEITAIEGQRPGTTRLARAGNTVEFTVQRFAPGTPTSLFEAEICDRASQSCTMPIPTTVTTDDDGNGQGKLVLPADPPPGDKELRLAAVDDEARAELRILGQRTVTITPAYGPPGTTVEVVGSNFDPTATVAVVGWTQSVQTRDGESVVTVRADGTFATSYAVRDAGTTDIWVSEMDAAEGAAAVPFLQPFLVLPSECTARPSCETRQRVTAVVKGGPLSSEVDPAIRVVDIRGIQAGWTISASTTPGDDRERLTLSPQCRDVSDGGTSAPGIIAGPAAQTFAEAVTLCVKDDQLGGGGSSGGIWEVDAPAETDEPAIITVLLA